MNRSLRRLGQLLVVMGALLGAITGVALALIVEDAETSRAVVVASGRERAAVLAANPSSSQPPASPAAGWGNRPASNDSTSNQHAESADRPEQQHGNAHKDREGDRDKPGGYGKDKSGKDRASNTLDDSRPAAVFAGQSRAAEQLELAASSSWSACTRCHRAVTAS